MTDNQNFAIFERPLNDFGRSDNGFMPNSHNFFWMLSIIYVIDSFNLFSVNITNPMPDSHYVYCIEAHLEEVGQPVDETFILPEYQLLYECIWVLRNPLCDKTPLFT